MKDVLGLYEEYHARRQDERLELFEVVRREYMSNSCLYPGCFVHITPAFVFPKTTFVDTDRRARRFFDDPRTLAFVEAKKLYDGQPQVRFLARDYSKELEIDTKHDLLVSQYAGFVSESCKKYLRKGGLLIVNNSHGDASLASIDDGFRLIAVIHRRGEHFWASKTRLDQYFVPARNVQVTRQLLYRTKHGIGYKRTASDYVFEKIS